MKSRTMNRAPTSLNEASEFVRAVKRWRAPRVNASTGERSPESRAATAVRPWAEDWLRSRGWTQRPHADGHECWWHSNREANMSTFVRAVRFTAQWELERLQRGNGDARVG